MNRHVAGNSWDAAAYDTQFGFVGRYGDEVLTLLNATDEDRVLDLGCGTGRHAAQIAEAGASVIGLDADQHMLEKAFADHPGIRFVRADATAFTLDDLGTAEPFTACFSNAALHWMTPQDAVLRNVRSVLETGGRFVAEMGGAGNIAALDGSLHAALQDLGLPNIDVHANHFPTVGEEASLLEESGFRVEFATWFRRPTPLEPGSTAADWTRHFRADTWAQVGPEAAPELAALVDSHAAERGLSTDSGWIADYCRLRFVAIAN